MGFDQYHEPPGELSGEARTYARMIASLTEEAEAIGWYAQRISLEPDGDARAIMENAQQEEFKHFAMDPCSPTATSSRRASGRRRPRGGLAAAEGGPDVACSNDSDLHRARPPT